jgi:hypothetical protein
LIAAGGASIAVAVLFAATLMVSSEARRVHVEPAAAPLEAPTAVWPSWIVTSANTAHDVLVVEVQAQRMDQARRIAEQIVNPVRSRGYLEILIYIQQAGKPDGPVRRIQWTPQAGYTESTLAAIP